MGRGQPAELASDLAMAGLFVLQGQHYSLLMRILSRLVITHAKGNVLHSIPVPIELDTTFFSRDRHLART